MSLLLLQYGPVHEELSPPCVSAAHALGLKAEVVLNPGSLRSKGDVFSFSRNSFRKWPKPSYLNLSKPSGMESLAQIIEHNTVRHVVFLTLQNDWTVELAIHLIRKYGVSCAGIIHNTDKLLSQRNVLEFWRSGTATPIVLASHVKRRLEADCGLSDSLRFQSIFDPLRQSEAESSTCSHREHDKSKLIVVPGGVNLGARNYLSLIKALKKSRFAHQEVSIRVMGGGKDRAKLEKAVVYEGIDAFFEWSPLDPVTGNNPYSAYYSDILSADAVLVLDGPGYKEKKITSSIPISISFLKPIVTTTDVARQYDITGMAWHASSLCDALEAFLSATETEVSSKRQGCLDIRSHALKENKHTLHYIVSS